MNSTTLFNSSDITNSLGTRPSGGLSNSANPGAVSNQLGVTNGNVLQDQDLSYDWNSAWRKEGDSDFISDLREGFFQTSFGKLFDTLFLGGSNAKQADINYKLWLAQHGSQLRMNDLRNAGLNPLLAGMSVASPNSAIYQPGGENQSSSGKDMLGLLAAILKIAASFAGGA